MSSGKYKLKERDTNTHLLEWPKSRTLTPLNAGEVVEQLELSFTAGETAIWYSCFLKHSLAISYKVKHTLTIISINHAPWYFTQRS